MKGRRQDGDQHGEEDCGAGDGTASPPAGMDIFYMDTHRGLFRGVRAMEAFLPQIILWQCVKKGGNRL